MSSSIIELESPNGFFKCFNCKTHIALSENHTLRESLDGKGKALGFVETVNTDTADYTFDLFAHSVQEVFCKICEIHLGWKLAEGYEGGVSPRNDGRFMLKRDLLEEVGGKGKGIKPEEVGGEGDGIKIEGVGGEGDGEKLEEVGGEGDGETPEEVGGEGDGERPEEVGGEGDGGRPEEVGGEGDGEKPEEVGGEGDGEKPEEVGGEGDGEKAEVVKGG